MSSYFVVSYVLWAMAAYWVYQDAQKRNLRVAFAWAILVFFLGILGVVGYYLWVIRPDKHDA